MDPFSNVKDIPEDWVPQATKLLTKLGESKKDNGQTDSKRTWEKRALLCCNKRWGELHYFDIYLTSLPDHLMDQQNHFTCFIECKCIGGLYGKPIYG